MSKKKSNNSKKQNNAKKVTKTAPKANNKIEKKETIDTKKNSNTTKIKENKNTEEKYSSKFGSTKPVKNIEKITTVESDDANELKKLAKLVVIVCIVIAVFYIITYFIKNNKNTNNNVDTTEEYTEIQYDEIILGELLTRKEEIYYVLAYSFDSGYADLYNMYISYSEGDSKIYTTNIDSVFNKKYISSESNLDITNISELRIKDVTLFKISNQQIVEYYEGRDAVIEHLKAL